MTLYASQPTLDGRELQYVTEVLRSGRLSQGPFVARLEAAWAERCGSRHAIACSSGTAALHLAMLALDVGPSRPVVVPALTYVATANAARYCGAPVVFCDVNEHNWCATADDFAAARTEAWFDDGVMPRVAVLVHLYDTAAPDLLGLDMAVVEDAAHLAPAVRTRAATLTTWSLYGSKILTCGEGGMITTDEADLAARARLYRGQGAPTPGRYWHELVGFNYRLSDLQAAVALAQLERVEEHVAARRVVVDEYRKALAPLLRTGLRFQRGPRGDAWAMAVLFPSAFERAVAASDLAMADIETRPFFEPIPTLPPYADSACPPIAAELAGRGLVLPTHEAVTERDVERVAGILASSMERNVQAALDVIGGVIEGIEITPC